MKLLPIGIQSFEVMRANGYLYVDKTKHIHQLVTSGQYYFLSRPRRFGKSLLVSTLRCLFQGRRELFEGLWIAEHSEWDWQEHPVISLDFNRTTHDTPESLPLSLSRLLTNQAALYDLTLDDPTVKGQFGELILKLHQKTGQPVIILVDEYDKPMIDHLGKGDAALDIAKANRDILKSLFGVIKGGDIAPVLRFVFLTGISRFSKVSIFSELNNLEDISMVDAFAAMLGYTEAELDLFFTDYVSSMASHLGSTESDLRQALATQYNGYRFAYKNEKVYNPFSIIHAFKHNKLKNYWFETATPSFLVNLLREKQYPLVRIENLEIVESVFGSYDLDNLQPEALLFQTGYTTIKDVEGRIFTLGYPNQEVKIGFLESLLQTHVTTSVVGLISAQIVRLSQYLEKHDLDSFFKTMNAIFAAIPYDKLQRADEGYFHTLFYLAVAASGMDARSEVLGFSGRIDLAVLFDDTVFVIEFKCNQTAEVAVQQLKDKRLANRYRQTGRSIYLLGINFDAEQRQVNDWIIESVE